MKPTILIVDDEPGVRSALSGVLRDEGYNVEAVPTGEACLDRVTRGSVDLIVLDVWLPGMDGLATLARLRERQVDVQVVLISGHGNIESAVRAIKMGAFDFVEKPLSLEKTVLVIRNALHQRRLEADHRGKFEVADGGTIFLDEIGDMSLKTQAKVLRVLQEQTMEAVGGTARIKVDARVLAATNKDLQAEIRAGRYREDLYFRLNVIPVFVPPLRDRQGDLPLLADHFMADFAREYGRRIKGFDAGAKSVLQHYPWPGNVRELRNVIERLMIMVPGDAISAPDLSFLDPTALTRTAAAEVQGERQTLHQA